MTLPSKSSLMEDPFVKNFVVKVEEDNKVLCVHFNVKIIFQTMLVNQWKALGEACNRNQRDKIKMNSW